jgi:hypothetical protein
MPYTASDTFNADTFPLRRVIAITKGSAVVAHVNCAFGDGESAAAFIVEACNTHDSLVAEVARLRKASKGALVLLERLAGDTNRYLIGGSDCSIGHYASYHVDTLRAALRAGGSLAALPVVLP